MKSLFKIISRYIGAAFFITFLILILNIFLDAYFVLYYGQLSQNLPSIQNIANEISKSDGTICITKRGREMLDAYEWGFLLDDAGTVIWSDRTPDNFKESYTSAEIASFSRWYL